MSEDEKLNAGLKALIAKYGIEKIKKIIDKYNYKKCPRCNKVLDYKEFGLNNKGNLNSYCYVCKQAYNKQYNKKYKK